MNEIVMPFDGRRIDVIRDEQGNLWVGVKSICLAIGIDAKSQRQKIIDDEKYRWGDITSPSAGGMQKTFCLPLNHLNGWLFS